MGFRQSRSLAFAGVIYLKWDAFGSVAPWIFTACLAAFVWLSYLIIRGTAPPTPITNFVMQPSLLAFHGPSPSTSIVQALLDRFQQLGLKSLPVPDAKYDASKNKKIPLKPGDVDEIVNKDKEISQEILEKAPALYAEIYKTSQGKIGLLKAESPLPAGDSVESPPPK